MSDIALRDLNIQPGSERKNESSSKGSLTKPCIENTNGNLEESQGNKSDCLIPTLINGDETVKSEVEVGNAEVEYIDSENLTDIEDVDVILKVHLFLNLFIYLFILYLLMAFSLNILLIKHSGY